MEVKLKVFRYDPEIEDARSIGAEQPGNYQDYTLEMPESATVLDALLKIREEEDGTLSFRCSCRSAICGSCSMRIGDQAGLACKEKLVEHREKSGEVKIDPMGNLPLIKDLVVDMGPFWSKIRAVDPWLRPTGPEPEREYLVPNERMQELIGVMNCIMCGACVSDCNSLAVDKGFLGPAALAKAYRFVRDPRDGTYEERLDSLTDITGVWDCTHCFYCVEVCPKGVAPMDRIMDMRRYGVEAGYSDSNGARHMDSLAKSVRESGWLDELKLTIETLGWFNIKELLSFLPTGLRALRANKMPPILHHSRPGADQVKRIFDKVESSTQGTETHDAHL